MTIDEAIEHAKEVARTCDDVECAAEHVQLAEWLRQARGADKAARWYTEKIRKLEAENSMLRERLLESRESNEHLYTELRRYKSIFRMKPRAMNALFDENSKLRELLQRNITTHDKMCTQRGNCFGCKFFGDFDSPICEPLRVNKEAEKLGIKVSK